MRQIESLNELKKVQQKMYGTIDKKSEDLFKAQIINNDKVNDLLHHQLSEK